MSESTNPLVTAYRQHIGPGSSNEAIGYWIFVLGAVLGIVGLLVYVYSTTLEGSAVFTSRQIAGVAGALGLASLLLGVVVRLPTHRHVTRLALAGMGLCVVAVGWFVLVYPADWPTPEGDPRIVGLYGVGAAILVLSAIVLPAVMRAPADAFADFAPAKVESKASFELYRDRAGEWRWRLRHDNGNIIATSGQGYRSKQSAQQGLTSVRNNTTGATEVEITTPADAAQASFEVSEGEGGAWRWRLVHDNGNRIADAVTDYTDRSSVEAAIDRVRRYAETADTLSLDTGAFDLFADSNGAWRWRLLAKNGRIIADSAGSYDSRLDARRAIATVQQLDGHGFRGVEVGDGRYRWRFAAETGDAIAVSNGTFSSRRGAKTAAERVKRIAPVADTLELDEGAFDLFTDDEGAWRWRLLAPNGDLIADSGEGYSSRAKARQGLGSVRRNAPNAPVRD